MLVSTGSEGAAREYLLDLYSRLTEDDRRTLLAFAEFLCGRTRGSAQVKEVLAAPVRLPRPEGESVVQAMKRLSITYEMVDSGPMLNDAAALMGAHVLQGRPAAEVIDELEQLFEQAYQRQLGEDDSE